MKKQTLIESFFALFLIVVLPSCASLLHAPDSKAEQLKELEGSHVEITYVLHHSEHRFAMRAKNGLVQGETDVDHETVKKNPIDPQHYAEFLKKVSDYIDQRVPASDEDDSCRAVYKIVLKMPNGQTRTQSGCRHAEKPEFSHLIRDGEFLLLSQH